MVEIRQLEKSFGKLSVLKGIDLKIPEGKICAVLGPNGSGKTTLTKCILGLVIPNKGDILINGESVLKKWDYRNKIGYMPQIARFPENLSPREIINMVCSLRPEKNHADKLVELFGVENELKKSLRELSGGTRQKFNAILALMFEEIDLLFFDEPTAGLDPISLIKMKELIRDRKKQGKTILLTTHIISLVEDLADEIIFLLDGVIFFQGSIDELKRKAKHNDLEHAIANILTKKEGNEQ